MQILGRSWLSRTPSDLCWCLHLLCLCLIPNTQKEALDCVRVHVCVGGLHRVESQSRKLKSKLCTHYEVEHVSVFHCSGGSRVGTYALAR